MELNRFKQLLESTLGNVKPLISEQLTGDTQVSGGTVIAITSPIDIPQSLVDEAAPTGTYDPAGRNPWYDIKDTSRGLTGGYTFRIQTNISNFNFGNTMEGKIEAATNDYFLAEQKTPEGIIVVAKFGPERIPATDVVKNTKDKWIGFVSADNTVRFACFNKVDGSFGCEKYGWKRK